MYRSLLTMMHISDLHIGDVANGAGPLDARAFDWWRQNSWFDGFLGHSHRALAAVHRRRLALRRQSGNWPLLIVTGDLSAVGDPTQLHHAQQYLTAKLPVPTLRHVGLGVADALDRTIPGNHDHWPGHHGVVGPTVATGPLFSSVPRDVTIPIATLGGRDVRLRIVGINSDADVWAWGPARLFARARCESQIAAAAQRFDAPDPDEIRVLLIHHTRLQHGYITGMTRGTRAALDALIADHDIAVVLCGHIHEPRIATDSPRHARGSALQCLEVCAGTTTQLDEPPPAWGLDDTDLARFRTNSLFVHRLLATDRGIIWQATLETRKGEMTGFSSDGVPIDPHAVWPR